MTTPTPTPTAPTLRERLAEYLAMRRALGFRLDDLERQVGLFCTWLEGQGQTQTFGIDDAVRWARLNPERTRRGGRRDCRWCAASPPT